MQCSQPCSVLVQPTCISVYALCRIYYPTRLCYPECIPNPNGIVPAIPLRSWNEARGTAVPTVHTAPALTRAAASSTLERIIGFSTYSWVPTMTGITQKVLVPNAAWRITYRI